MRTQQRRRFLATALAILTLAAGTAAGASPRPPKLPPNYDRLISIATAEVKRWVQEPAVVKAVLEKNAQKETMAEIHRIDKEWVAAPQLTPLMKSLLTNPCAVRLTQLQKPNPAYSKTFVFDAQGANVCMTIRTDDYWQGDEDKWAKTFPVGPDAVFVDKPVYNERLKANVVQISATVSDQGKAIGGLTATINLDWLTKK